MDQGQHVQLALAFPPPDGPHRSFPVQAATPAQQGRRRVAVLGKGMQGGIEQHMDNARQAHQGQALGQRPQGAGGQAQHGLHFPVRAAAAHREAHRLCQPETRIS